MATPTPTPLSHSKARYRGGHGLHDRFAACVKELFQRKPSESERLRKRASLHGFRERFARPSLQSETPFDDLVKRNPEFAIFCEPAVLGPVAGGAPLDRDGDEELEDYAFDVRHRKEMQYKKEVLKALSKPDGHRRAAVIRREYGFVGVAALEPPRDSLLEPSPELLRQIHTHSAGSGGEVAVPKRVAQLRQEESVRRSKNYPAAFAPRDQETKSQWRFPQSETSSPLGSSMSRRATVCVGESSTNAVSAIREGKRPVYYSGPAQRTSVVPKLERRTSLETKALGVGNGTASGSGEHLARPKIENRQPRRCDSVTSLTERVRGRLNSITERLLEGKHTDVGQSADMRQREGGPPLLDVEIDDSRLDAPLLDAWKRILASAKARHAAGKGEN